MKIFNLLVGGAPENLPDNLNDFEGDWIGVEAVASTDVMSGASCVAADGAGDRTGPTGPTGESEPSP